MQTPTDKPEDFGAEFKLRCPADFVPRLHAFSRSKGLTASALVRMLVINAMDAEERQRAA